MKEIATLTTHGADNYGAILQAHALRRYIEGMGYECRILNYIPEYTVEEYRLIRTPKNLRWVIYAAYQVIHYNKRKKRKDRFAAFRDQYMALSGDVIKKVDDLVQIANEYDTVVIGSDQIWNPRIHDADEAYFLSFPDVATRKISYAASFGQDSIDETFKPEMARRLRGFSEFACREHSGIQIIKELTGKEASFVLDPIFLIDVEEWTKLALAPNDTAHYDMLYFLSDPGKSPYALKKYSERRGNTTLSIGFSPYDCRYRVTCNYTLGPREFLGAIKNADCIITNSFHCTAFAILFEKRFFVRLQSGKDARNDRMLSLLTELGLEDRTYFDKNAEKLDFDKEIDYKAAKEKLNALIRQSKGYLSRALGV